jgi:hypothetical protein
MRDVEDERAAGGGTSRTVDATAGDAYTCAGKSLRAEGGRLEEHADQRTVFAPLTSMGTTITNAGAWVEPADGNRAKVTVVTKRATMTITTQLTEDRLLQDIERCAAQLKAGPSATQKP